MRLIYKTKFLFMKPDEKEMTPDQSLKIITGMIGNARQKVQANGFYLILWGCLISLAHIASYIMIQIDMTEYQGIAWMVCVGIGVISSMLYGILVERKKTTGTLLDQIYGFVWLTFFVSWTMMIVFMLMGKIELGGILIYVFAANSVFLTGAIIKFRPLLYGGIVLWITSIALFLLEYPNSEHQLIGAAGLILGYIVPGLMLNAKLKKERQEDEWQTA